MSVVRQGGGSPASARDAAAPLAAMALVNRSVDSRISYLQAGYRADRSEAVSSVARIRRGAGRPAGENPDLWGLIGAEALYERGWNEEEAGRAENAVHMAVTLWALHQQGHHAANMHVRNGPGLGAAVRRLMPDAAIDEPIRKRFVRAGMATSVDALGTRLRELVLLLRRDDIGLDYGLLASQLHQWQRPGGRAEVHRAWGRSFHSYGPVKSDEEKG
ncbi:type I-E CRISPR-associated protein Cse2/CasB [Streptomyces sp. ITFR-16]|uniref:type I-E CRISPR-associated protein Cse2/CasB n=1 Tax=Streptomyces sp. ITFR-16 TaxID=3075198 RepID=UPI00288BF142|nr:type I-E CRISPR-associated protein Cse2/CasB [Streptomyces sp. ITFR-16]WNI23812.1 type I-E CRISPR-associated protein Cse2/CasB [Streptomyces sp. ITFR-16]